MIRVLIEISGLLALLACSISGFSQRCDSLQYPHKHSLPFSPEGLITTLDYIQRYHPRQSMLVSRRDTLKQIPVILNIGNNMIFSDKDIEVIIEFSDTILDVNTYFYKRPGEKYNAINQLADYEYLYGINSEDTLYSIIKSISVNGVMLDSKRFHDLISPNRHFYYESIRPIEVFCDNYAIYVYIFGDVNSEFLSPFEAIEFSYMAKLVFTIKGYYSGRIVEEAKILKYFGFEYCRNFIGF